MTDSESKIREMYDRWRVAVNSSSVDGYISCLDENITMCPPGGAAIKGHVQYREFLKPVFDAATYERVDNSCEIELFGDIAIVRSRITVHLTFLGDATQVASEGALQKNLTVGDYLDIVKRQDDGSWKVLVHTWQEVEGD